MIATISIDTWINLVGVIGIPIAGTIIGYIVRSFRRAIQEEREARQEQYEALTNAMKTLTDRIEEVKEDGSKDLEELKKWADTSFVDSKELEISFLKFSTEVTSEISKISKENKTSMQSLVEAIMIHNSLMEHRATVLEAHLGLESPKPSQPSLHIPT